MNHAISYGARTFAWPSIAAASLMLCDRIDAAQDRADEERSYIYRGIE